MTTTEVHKFISKYYCSEDSEINILSQPGLTCKAGRWCVPDDQRIKFLEKINEVLTLIPNKQIKRRLGIMRKVNQTISLLPASKTSKNKRAPRTPIVKTMMSIKR